MFISPVSCASKSSSSYQCNLPKTKTSELQKSWEIIWIRSISRAGISFIWKRNKRKEEGKTKFQHYMCNNSINRTIREGIKRENNEISFRWKKIAVVWRDAGCAGSRPRAEQLKTHTNFETNLLTQITERCSLDKWSQCFTLLFYLPWICGAFGL